MFFSHTWYFQVGRIQVIAFQSSDGKQHHMSRPISLSPVNKSPVIEVESSLSTSENEPARSFRAECPEQDTADSRTSGTIKVYPFQISNKTAKKEEIKTMLIDPGSRALIPVSFHDS